MKKSIVLAVSIPLILSACGMMEAKKTVPVKTGDSVDQQISASAKNIQSEMALILMDKKHVDPVKAVNNIHGCATKKLSIDFDGDVMLFIDQLNKSRLCEIRVDGKKPNQDMILSLHHENTPLWQVLEDAGVQLGSMAMISVSVKSVVFAFGTNN